MKTDCIFCQIVKKQAPSYTFWENEDFIAFLSIFPNTPGASVVIPREHYPSYAFNLPPDMLTALTLAAKEVAKILDSKLNGVGRTAMVYEGFGVDHAHAKLFPMHGTANMLEWRAINSSLRKTFDKYEGYISSHDGPRASDESLNSIHKQLRGLK